MIRWSPSTELANLHSAMDHLFDDFFGQAPASGGSRQRGRSTYLLPLDIRDVDNGYEIRAAVPGFKPEEVEVTLTEGVLRIAARHSEVSTEDKGGYLRREMAFGDFERTIQLPGDVKEEDISAEFEDGMLILSIPKAPRPQPRKIQVAGPQKQLAAAKS